MTFQLDVSSLVRQQNTAAESAFYEIGKHAYSSKRQFINGKPVTLSLKGSWRRLKECSTSNAEAYTSTRTETAIPQQGSITNDGIEASEVLYSHSEVEQNAKLESMNVTYKDWQQSKPYCETNIARALNCLMERIEVGEKDLERAQKFFDDGLGKQSTVDKIWHRLEQDKAICGVLTGINAAVAQICDIVPSDELILSVTIKCAHRYEYVKTDEAARFRRGTDGEREYLNVEFVKPSKLNGNGQLR